MTEENTLKNEGLRIYEIGYLLLPNIVEENLSEEVFKIKEAIEKEDGKFISEGTPQMRELTYPMIKLIKGKKQKFSNAYFGFIKFEASSENISGIKKTIDKNNNVLRFLIILSSKEDFDVPKKTESGKFSFGEEKEKVTIKDKKVITEENSEEGSGDENNKELDETIDQLVIE